MRRCVDDTTAAPIVRRHPRQQQQQRHLLSLLRRCGTSAREASSSHVVAPHRVACGPCAGARVGSKGGRDALTSLRGPNTILRTRRWLNADTNRYLQEQQEYIPAVREAAEELLTRLEPLQDHIPIEMERFFRALHADALVALFEYFVTYRPRSLFRSLRDGEGCGCEASPLCELLLAALAERSVELSSKHVAFIGALYSASGVEARLFPFILYHARHSLRRTQAVQALRTISVMSFHAVDTLRFGPRHPLLGAATSGTPLLTSALSSVMVRCMELEQTHEGYDTRSLLSQALMRHYSRVQPDVRAACLWWVRRGLHKSNGISHSAVLEVRLDDAPLPADAFSAMEAASRSLTLPAFDSAHLRLLLKKDSAVDSSWRASTSRAAYPAATEQGDPALLLHQQLPTLQRLHGEVKLLALETLSRRVLEITQLDAVVGLAEGVLRYSPSLSEVVMHRLLQLACLDSAGATAVSTLTAMHRLLPHVDVMGVVEGAMMCGVCTSALAGRRAGVKPATAPPPDSLVKCLAMHLPSSLLPALFHRLCRQRELAAFRLPPFVLRVLLQALEYTNADSLSCEDATCIQAFIRQERRKALPHFRPTLAPNPNEKAEMGMERGEDKLLAAIDACAMLHCRSSNGSGDVSLQLPPTSTNPATESCKAAGAAKAALASLFGVRATTLVTTEAAVRERTSLAWLYAIYRMSVSIMCELEALATLALRQGAQLRLNERQRTLVELSESVDENLMLPDVNRQVSAGNMNKDALRACIEEWLLNKETSGQALQRLVALLEKEDVALAPFLCYAAIARHDVTAIKELRLRAPAASAIFSREGSLDSAGMYAMPLRSAAPCAATADSAAVVSVEAAAVECHSTTSRGVACGGGGASIAVTNRGGNGCDGAAADADPRQGSHMPDLTTAAAFVLRFAEEHWGDKAPAGVDAARLWAQVDLLLLTKDFARKLEFYEAVLRLCQKERLAGFAGRVPAAVHREVFAAIGGKGLWAQGLDLLRLAESGSGGMRVPLQAYQQVMRACLMHRVPVPAFLREKSKGTVSVE
ncbi:uncharacterized protein Tco025E_01211 [Trypanosoma conorhini]|uniref:Uncharacterized protein n=1 Tax=Trypanosoma conorhini TaxID=83891 RepID=A0A422Q960_9TRYP|nr:uncharacterized protein Tco025E_01211 [Trypanosoma conorhini]RNF26506.1 hypothetical protein Tco025E_01211 [Trypanosoma conorhini]